MSSRLDYSCQFWFFYFMCETRQFFKLIFSIIRFSNLHYVGNTYFSHTSSCTVLSHICWGRRVFHLQSHVHILDRNLLHTQVDILVCMAIWLVEESDTVEYPRKHLHHLRRSLKIDFKAKHQLNFLSTYFCISAVKLKKIIHKNLSHSIYR